MRHPDDFKSVDRNSILAVQILMHLGQLTTQGEGMRSGSTEHPCKRVHALYEHRAGETVMLWPKSESPGLDVGSTKVVELGLSEVPGTASASSAVSFLTAAAVGTTHPSEQTVLTTRYDASDEKPVNVDEWKVKDFEKDWETFEQLLSDASVESPDEARRMAREYNFWHASKPSTTISHHLNEVPSLTSLERID